MDNAQVAIHPSFFNQENVLKIKTTSSLIQTVHHGCKESAPDVHQEHLLTTKENANKSALTATPITLIMDNAQVATQDSNGCKEDAKKLLYKIVVKE